MDRHWLRSIRSGTYSLSVFIRRPFSFMPSQLFQACEPTLGGPSKGLRTPLTRAPSKHNPARSKRALYKPYFCLPSHPTLASGAASPRPGHSSSLSRARQVARFGAFNQLTGKTTLNHDVPPPLMQPPGLDQPRDSYIPSAPFLFQERRKRLPLNSFSWIPNEVSTNHPRFQPGYDILSTPGHTSGVYAQCITAFDAAPLRQPSEPSSSLYSSHPRPIRVAQPLFFPGTSNSSLWGLSGLVGIPSTGSGAGGWAGAPRMSIPNAPLGGQSRVNPTAFTSCACPSCAPACQPLVNAPPQPNPPRPTPSALPTLLPSRPQAVASRVPAQAPSLIDDLEGEDWDPLEPRHHLRPSSYYSYEPPPTLHHGGVSFTISQFLGKGAAGRVVLGEHRGKLYAIKGIHKRCAQKYRHTRDDFLREKKCMAAISTVERSKRFLMSLVMAWEEPEMIYFVMVRLPSVGRDLEVVLWLTSLALAIPSCRPARRIVVGPPHLGRPLLVLPGTSE